MYHDTMKILSDDKIPLVQELFGEQAEIRFKPGTQISQADLKDIDILLVRTITQVNRHLLHNTAVRFVGTATTGTDHLDTHYLAEHAIHWFSAKGANAQAVVNYVQACIAALQQAKLIPLNPSLGIIGAGEIGIKVASNLKTTCSKILLNDPPRARAESRFNSAPLNDLAQLDIISLHTPLSKSGEFPSYHLLDKNFLEQLKPNSVLINTARGGVLDEQALLNLKKLPILCLDVWEHEPNINLELMQHCFIATPHIAGYSLEAKNRASLMLYNALSNVLGWSAVPDTFKNSTQQQDVSVAEILQHYNPNNDSAVMKKSLESCGEAKQEFENLRRTYKLRQEF